MEKFNIMTLRPDQTMRSSQIRVYTACFHDKSRKKCILLSAFEYIQQTTFSGKQILEG